jgi:hypothetical protein
MVSRLKESIAQCYDTKVMLTADVFCFRYDGPRLANLTWTLNLMPPLPPPPFGPGPEAHPQSCTRHVPQRVR